MSILDPRLWLAVLAALVLSFGGGYLKGRGDGRNSERAAQQKATLAAVQTARAEEQRRTAAQTEIATNAKKDADQARADARAAADVSDRLRARIADLLAQHPAAPTGGAPADTTDALLAELFRRADERAGSLAQDLDASRIAGQACERAYDSLTDGAAK